MTRDEFGFWLFVAVMAGCFVVAYLLAYVLEVPWFRERLTSQERWTRTVGMLPIAVPAYLIANIIFFRRYP